MLYPFTAKHTRLLVSRMLLLLMFLTVVGCQPQQAEQQAADDPAQDRLVRQDNPPNFLLIMTDDQNYLTTEYMPILQRELIAQGAHFVNGFATTPLCCPTRVSVLRGQYSYNHMVYNNAGPLGGFSRFQDLGLEDSTLALWLQDAGYTTGLFGKYLNGYPVIDDPTYIPPGWDEWYGWLGPVPREALAAAAAAGAQSEEGDDEEGPVDATYNGYFNYEINQNGELQQYDDAYLTDVLADYADTFIRETTAQNQPFFAFVTPFAPHSPYIPAPRHVGMFADVELPRSPAFNELDMSDKPEQLQRNDLLTDEQITILEANYRKQLESLQAVDEMIGRFVATLDEIGALENTYIIFISDNGYHHGERRRMSGKGRPYEEDTRIPFVIRGPNIEPGSVFDPLVLAHDLTPTIADLAGASVPDFVDGSSMVPLWTEANPVWRDRFAIFRQIKEYQAVRTQTHLYIEHLRWDVYELYDLREDPYQLENIYTEAAGAPFREHMESLLACAGATCRDAEGFDVQP